MTSQADLFDAVQLYFDALHHCDTEKLNAVFHEKSSLFDADNGTVFVEPIESFSRDVGSRTSPASQGQNPDYEILMLDWLSSKSALVKIRLRAHQNVFVDHLSFLLGEDGWKIVAKTWHLERVVEGA